MGVHDYVCFVLRNGQNLVEFPLLNEPMSTYAEISEFLQYDRPLSNEDCLEAISEMESEGYGNNKAIIVLMPKKFAKKDIYGWSLDKFAGYPTVTTEYSWESWNFKDINGYGDVLSNSPECIWETKDEQYKDYWLVNFSPLAYECFVEKKHNPLSISISYYNIILEDTGRSIVESFMDKTKLFDCVCKGLNLDTASLC